MFGSHDFFADRLYICEYRVSSRFLKRLEQCLYGALVHLYSRLPLRPIEFLMLFSSKLTGCTLTLHYLDFIQVFHVRITENIEMDEKVNIDVIIGLK